MPINNFTDLVAKLTLEEKVSLLTGLDNNYTVAMPKIGLRSILMSNGPAGVRGPSWDERETSINLPAPINLAATWSTELASSYGNVLANEAKRKGVDIVLGPTVNMQRTPNAGRHFEAYSEDPLLTAKIGASLVAATQHQGIGTCTKHYVCNDFETDRFTANVVVSERALREVYLRPFEEAVVEARAWSIMSAYNRVNGFASTESPLLTDPLRSEWEFDGVMVGDWTAVRTLEAAKADQDLVMPGPTGPWGQLLVESVLAGDIPEELIDTKVARLLLLAQRVGALGLAGEVPEPRERLPIDAQADEDFAYECAVESLVLAKNSGLLPLNPQSHKKLAVIGHLAERGRTQGGGSAMVTPKSVVSIVEAFTKQANYSVEYALGAKVHDELEPLKLSAMRNPLNGKPGIQAEFIDPSGEVIFTDHRISSQPVWMGGDAPTRSAVQLRVSFYLTLTEDCELNFGFASAFGATVTIDGEPFLNRPAKLPIDMQSLLHPPRATVPFRFEANRSYLVQAEVDMSGRFGRAQDFFAFPMGTEVGSADPGALIAEAVKLAESSDAVIVTVGTNSKVESEGFDRASLDLPGHQNELVEALVSANQNVVVVVNSGAPVLLPWLDKVQAVVIAHLPGQHMGAAIVDTILGQASPGGRLPTTWPAHSEDLPVWDNTPDVDGQMQYAEDIHVGYRAWLKAGAEPAFWLGHGLSYTTMTVEFAGVAVDSSAANCVRTWFNVSNTGSRTSSNVVQVFASTADSETDRPFRWLVGFEKIWLAPGETQSVEVCIPIREFMHWDSGWNLESGSYQLHLGLSDSEPIGSVSL